MKSVDFVYCREHEKMRENVYPRFKVRQEAEKEKTLKWKSKHVCLRLQVEASSTTLHQCFP